MGDVGTFIERNLLKSHRYGSDFGGIIEDSSAPWVTVQMSDIRHRMSDVGGHPGEPKRQMADIGGQMVNSKFEYRKPTFGFHSMPGRH